ncbi:MAG: HD domain-containing protein [Armatimonadetes bacterium]|nr:HD domain-containing protein [Armatimonadota bacterium]
MSNLVMQALRVCVAAHEGQWRDGEHPVPYACHPIEVMQNLRLIGCVTDPEILAAALLHDVLEETPVTLEDLHAEFPRRVGDLVKEVTRREPTGDEIIGMSKHEIWGLRTSILLDEIHVMSGEAHLLKLADRLSNLREAKRTRSEKKLTRYQLQTRWILELIPREVCPSLMDAMEKELD